MARKKAGTALASVAEPEMNWARQFSLELALRHKKVAKEVIKDAEVYYKFLISK